MTLSRRQFLSIGISLGGTFLNPLKAFGWGSFDGIANTHQLIVRNAMAFLQNDFVMKSNVFPSVDDILSSDWVNGIYGTGPDVEGFSNYSDHYYNPRTEKGNGPSAAGSQFNNLILKRHQNSNDKTAAKCAAWAAHFLNDMHVPYHVIGIPGIEAHSNLRSKKGYLTPDESGPAVLYGPQLQAKHGWGKNQNFVRAIKKYIEKHPIENGKIGNVDWHDPWYDNGIGVGTATTVFGSHSKWEFLAHRGWRTKDANVIYQKLANESYYDPQWQNQKRPLNQNPWTFAGQQAKNFAKQAANETRQNLIFYYGYPTNAICRAIRSTLTLYRSALTAIKIESIRYKKLENGQYQITCKLHNIHQRETFQEVDARLYWREDNGQWKAGGVIRLNEGLRATNYVDVWWFIKPNNNKKVEIVCDVNGVYPHTPDLGYRQKRMTFITGEYSQLPEPEPQPAPQPTPPPSNECDVCGRYSARATLTNSRISSKEVRCERTGASFRITKRNENGRMVLQLKSNNVVVTKPYGSGKTMSVSYTKEYPFSDDAWGEGVSKSTYSLTFGNNMVRGTKTSTRTYKRSSSRKYNESCSYTLNGKKTR